MTKVPLGDIIRSYFQDYLVCQRGLSDATIKSYRDGLRLFLQFLARENNTKISRLSLSDLTSDQVIAFLNEIEQQRLNHISTRNQRLTSLRSFFDYVAHRDPTTLCEAERVDKIPRKRVAPPATISLEPDEVEKLFSNLPKRGKFSLRDRVLLLFLYNTGARVQETADLRVSNLELEDSPRVHLHGKGDKWRVCPLWQETRQLLQQLLEENNALNGLDEPVFRSIRGNPLTRFGIYKIVRKHSRELMKTGAPDAKSISPHSLRHSTAVHLLESGVEINVIRAWLGHVSLETTNRYAELTLRMKEAALSKCEPPADILDKSHRRLRWRDDKDLLKWLNSL
jgi:site-specific recombinase XerD